MNARQLATVLCLALWPGLSHAEPCDSKLPEAGAPVRVPLGPADIGMLPEACAATSLELRGHMGVLIAMDDYYGQLTLGGAPRGRLELPGGSWLSMQLAGVEYRFLANATVEADAVELGATTVGWHQPLPVTERLQLAPFVRVLLPTESVYRNAAHFGLEHGVSSVFNVHPMFEVMGGYSIPLVLTTSYGGTHSVYTPTLTADAGFRPWSWFEVVGGVSLRIVPPDPEPFESFDPRASLRFYPWRGLLVDVAGAWPLGGRDRTNAAVGLSLGWLLEP